MKLSIIIANHNYRDFVGAAIESALAVDWLDKEVIIVDDASTDDSRAIIERFGSRVAAYFRPKSHQLGAHNFGLEQSTGDIIIFLDSDDLLEPEVMQEIAKVWHPGVSKVQYRMDLIDATGTRLGSAIPQFPKKDDPKKLRRVFLKTMAYTTPPGSGNAYARDFARTTFTLAPSTMWSSDDPLLTLAPLLGDVLTIRKPLGRYRIHGKNVGALDSLQTQKLHMRLHQDVEKANLFVTVSKQLGVPVPRDPLRYSVHHLQYRFASYLADPSAHPFRQDKLSGLVWCLGSSTISFSQMQLRDKAILIAWTIVSALAPPKFRQSFLLWRFVPTSRPRIIEGLLAIFARSNRRAFPTGL